ncbi:SPOSA6832_04081 [Sporobolomyces salmonicolor]|uniref:SPOSA6832_04081-mRNA-1:cds n=1 Tax=Sporidiobolus salmonicolor TaxID=5005 RepID=A0A0D6EQG9_SPOSA|nr:SPOSA6832_04081 [Sporobolomyces salmonicolor]
MAATSKLFAPLQVGEITLSHRIAMAPLTRFHVHAEYYSQRGSYPGTLLITEATFIDAKAAGYKGAPGIWTDEQIVGWKKVVDAGSSPLSHRLRTEQKLTLPCEHVLKEELGADVVSSSDLAFEGGAKPRALTQEEIKEYVGFYARAAKNFVEKAGGDGVEIHGANGYLIDQFTQTTCNTRTDEYGGSVENRVRFGLEVVDAVVAAVGAKKTGIRLSPYSAFQETELDGFGFTGMKMELPAIKETFTYFVEQIKSRHPDFAYIHAVESRIAGNYEIEADAAETLDFINELWAPRPFFHAGGFKADTAAATADENENAVIVFGRYFISNPDLVARIKNNVPFTEYDRETFYKIGPTETKGYIDYPFATKN